MDTSLDNANNPFANSNGADNTIIGQKTEGLLLNLSENFKHNGSDISPTADFYHSSEKSNGKRLASEFDDDDDLGPETDVDAVDDVLSPSIAAAKALADGIVNNNPDGSFNPFVEKHEVEKAALEIDFDLQKQQSSEFDGQRSPREETPTPPADAVHDGGLEENIGDSGEESEDEWNYIKGEEANKENISPSQPDCEVAGILEEQDSMSQLNPNAAEFVPVSPTRSIPSPACRLVHDPVIAQSPKRPSEIDINLPNPQEFEKEVKSRPSDFDTFSNGHDNEGDEQPPSSAQDLMENLLNGKNIDDIPEFQPGNTPSKSGDEFHFGPNAAPFTPVKLLDQSEAAVSTRAVYGDDESTGNLDCTLDTSRDNVDFSSKQKEDDPMSMSFYQDKMGSDVDPFDLNKVQVLPEDIDDFLNKPDDEIVLNNDERIQTTDLDKMLDDEKELASPVSNDDESSGVCELAKSPQPPTEDLLGSFEADVCFRPDSKSPQLIVTEEPKVESAVSPSPEPLEPEKREVLSPEPVEPEVQELLVQEPEKEVVSPEPQAPILSSEPQEPALSPEPEPEELLCQIRKSPEPEPQEPVLSPEPEELLCPIRKSPEPQEPILSPEPEELVCPIRKSPEPQEPVLSPEPEELVCPIRKSPEPQEPPALSPEPEELLCQIRKSPAPEPQEPAEILCQIRKSPAPEAEVPSALSPEPEPLVCQLPRSPAPEPEPEERREVSVESPIEDVTSSVKDVSSPVVSSPIPDQLAPEPKIELNFAQEINNAVQSTVPVEASSPLRDEIPDLCPLSTPKSIADTESVATTDVNSFLERSQIEDLTSPLSVDQPLQSESPITTEIKTENIIPEYAEPAVLTPTDKEETPSVPSQEEIVKEPEVAVGAVAAAGAVAATAAAAAVVAEKKPTAKAKTPTAAKKPGAKPTTTLTKTATSPTKPKAKPTTTAPPRTISKPAPKPKTTTTPAAAKPTTERKSLTNGDVKPPVRSSLTARTATKSPAAGVKAAVPKPSPTKTAAPRPTTAPAKTATKPATTTAAKPRPSTLASRTAASTVTKTTSSTTAAKLSASRPLTSPKTASPPKPRPATAPAKPKTSLTKTATKTSTDTEKQNKDSANKLTASRTVTSTRTTTTGSARSVTSTVRKTDSKTAGTTRTTLTKTTTTSTAGAARPGAIKRPQEITRNAAATKAKTTKIEKPVQNGVTTVVTEQITIVNNVVNESDSQLLKDNSPIDNKLIVETNAAD